jgi:hypothetical protein
LYLEEMLDYSLERSMCIPGIMDDMMVEEGCPFRRKQQKPSVVIAGKDRSAAEDAEGWDGMLGHLPEPQSAANCTGALWEKDQESLMTRVAAKNTVKKSG